MDAEHQYDQRKTNDAFTSARNRSNRTTAPHESTNTSVDAHAVGATTGGGVGAATANTPSVTSNGEVIETWSRLGGRRERAPGEGPIGPPSDHRGGFARFAGYERRVSIQKARERAASMLIFPFIPTQRERQPAMPAPKQSSEANEKKNQDEGHSSSDVDLSKHATYVLDSLQLDDDEDEYQRLDAQAAPQQPTQPQQQQQQQFSDWSPETQDWLYRDPSGQVQGPFKANLMQDWYAANYFDSQLLVRRVEEDAFVPLGEMLLTIGDAVSPFFIPPIAYARRGYNGQAGAVQQQSAASTESPSHQQMHPSNPLGWPGNLDILNHYGNGSGHSSPFATPQGRFAELDGGSRLRQKTQQEQYQEMIRQRELAEQRAVYEQRAAQMAAIAMAQSQGRDPASLGLWGAEAMMGGDWNQMSHQQQAHFGEDLRYHHQQQQQQLPQQYYDQSTQRMVQPAWDQTHAQGHTQGETEPVAQPVQQDALPDQRLDDVSEASLQREDLSAPDGGEVIPAEANLQPISFADDIESNDTVEEEPAAVIEEEQSPEQVWPQSPTAVEFASEPLMSEDPWSKEESPSRGKKSRKERTKQKTDEEVKPSRSASTINSNSIKTVNEDQFRRSQAGSRESSTSVSTPLSSWLPDTATGGPAAKTAPWANNAQDNAGLSLRDIQEAEARQAEARKAARPRLQLSRTASNDGSPLPTTTMSWGLASSHSNNGRDAALTQSPAVTPAWNARQAPKKTLMEIQEEEQKRAQKIKIAQAAQTEGKSKAYADSASKMQSSSNGVASSWSVVGAGGKPSAPMSVLSRPGKANSPVAQRIVSGSNAPAASPIWSSSTTNGPSAKTQTTPRRAIIDPANAPSANFIRYCKEQLKGLNVKVDDFIEMLLSFPLDPSPDVVDIIAESVYASSSTLDGRRFAADFVAKRKLDASQGKITSGTAKLSSSQSNGPTSNSNARSLSDVLKTAPAPANDGFGGFKVVKAKGAKKR
jgi:PERQ amino acid-rich with GYF domain-containing protein